MKVSSAGSDTGTPPMKKLKQARLPFQVITPETAKSQETKKRKLSEEGEETPHNKVVKKSISPEFEQSVPIKQNDEVVASDEDEKTSQDGENEVETSPKQVNPLVNIVDVALKRKLNKKKAPRKKEGKTKNRNKTKHGDNVEKVIDEIKSDLDTVDNSKVEVTNSKDVKVCNKENINQVILIEDSNDCEIERNLQCDVKESESSELNVAKEDVKMCSEEGIVPKDNKEVRKKGPKVISSMKDEGIVEISEDEDSDEETTHADEETASEKLDKDVINDSMPVDDEKELDDSEDEQDKGETSTMNSSLDTSDCDVSMSEVSDDTRNKSPGGNDDAENKTPKSNKVAGEKTTDSPQTPAERLKLTPKQLQKKMDSAKKQQEREKEKQDRLRKKQEEKEERNRQRLEKEEQKKKEREEKEEQRKREKEEKDRQREQEKKEREEKEETKRKEREEKELQKKREKEAKEEEKRKKDLEREEDRRKKEIEKEEAEMKKKKAAAAFVNFFVPKASGSKQADISEPVIKHNFLSNFTKKADMRLAPLYRKKLSDEEKSCLDEHLSTQSVNKTDMFVKQIKDKDYEVGMSSRTWPLEEEDVMIVEDELSIDSVNFVPEENHKQKMRAKLLSFSENRRPPFWGTWRRKSKNITGRNPFGMDSNILDYECDSDDEWEEEEPGESVGGSVAGSDDEEEDNDYDVDNDFMVPHGYLSEEEARDDEDEVLSPESQKAKLKIMQSEFEKEMKKNIDKLHPRSIGIIWQNTDGGKPESCKDSLWDFLVNKKILTEDNTIVIRPKPIVEDCLPEEMKNEKSLKKSKKITEDMTPDLIRLVHGNVNNRSFLAHEYQSYLAKIHKEQNEENAEVYINVSKMSIAKRIKEISKWMSCPIEGPMFGKMCWCVAKEVFEKFDTVVELPNKWNYVLTPKSKANVTQITQFLNSEQTNT